MNAPRKPTSLLGRWTWHLHHPLVALVALGALVLSVWKLPRQGAEGWIDRLIGRPVQMRSGGVPGIYLLRHGDDPKVEFQIINTDTESTDRLMQLWKDRPQDLIYCGVNLRVVRRGMWYPSNELTQIQVQMNSLMSAETMNAFGVGEMSRARKRYVEWLASPTGGNQPKEAALIGVDDIIVPRLVMSEALKNAGTIAAACLLPLSLWGMPNYYRVWRAKRLIRKGRCGVCRYDLEGIARGADGLQCPECGAVWP